MKLQATLAAALLMLAPSLHAFSLDLGSIVGALPKTVAVAGYGNVSIFNGRDAATQLFTTAEVGTNFGSPSIQFDSGDVVYITFLSGAALSFQASETGVDGTEAFSYVVSPDQTRYQITLKGAGAGGAGVSAVNFTAAAPVPEPSASILGLIGAAGLIIRRRR